MDISYQINLALKEFSNGNKNLAYKKLKNIFKKDKQNDLLRFNIAVIEQSLNFNELAKNNYKYLINTKLKIKAMVNLYLTYIKEDNFKTALFYINELISFSVIDANIIKDQAFVLYKLKRNDESIKVCKKYLTNNNDLDFINILGLNYFSINDLKKAESIFKKGLEVEKENPNLLNSLGRLYHESRDSRNAEKYLLKAYKIKNDSYEITNNLAGYYREEGKYKKAIELYNEALRINPNSPSIINNLAKVYFDMDELDLAKKYCIQALKLNENDGNIQKILSLIFFREHNFRDAWIYFEGRLNLSDFVEKNSSIEIIRKKLLFKNKINNKSKILILREQGIGDELLYGTIYSDVIKSSDNITIECDKRLKNIFINSFPNSENKFFKLGTFSESKEKLNQFDYVIYAGSLGRFFRNDIKDFNNGKLLKANESLVRKSKISLGKLDYKYNIGISWKSFKNRYQDEKSLVLEDFNKIFSSKNCNFINLQYGDVKEEIVNFNSKFNRNIVTLDYLDLFNDFDNLAAVLKNLDLFICVSNSTAHLAGSLGVKTLLIRPLNHAVFHYWNQPNNKTPWYESVVLINKSDIKKQNLVKKYLGI